MQVARERSDLIDPAAIRAVRGVLIDFEVMVLSALEYQVDRDWKMEPRNLPDTFLFIPLQGRIRAVVGDEERCLGPGELMLVPEGVEHSASLASGCSSFTVISIHCHIQDGRGHHLAPMFPSTFMDMKGFEHRKDQLQRLVCLMNQDEEAGREWGGLVLKDLLASLIMDGQELEHPARGADHRIARALRTIHEQYGEDISVEQMAGEARLSTVQFRKLFRKALHAGPKAYLVEYRLRIAGDLLRATALSVKEIAYETGFKDNRYFHLCFRRKYGITPSRYRERVAGEM